MTRATGVRHAEAGCPLRYGGVVVSDHLPEAGWYENPEGDGLRWWDGQQWTDHYHHESEQAEDSGGGSGWKDKLKNLANQGVEAAKAKIDERRLLAASERNEPAPKLEEGESAPTIIALRHSRQFTSDDGETMDGEGFRLVTSEGLWWPEYNCRVGDWDVLGIYQPEVVGESYAGRDLQHRSLEPGNPVRLVPEPENPHDENAIAVTSWEGRKKAGYVKASNTRTVRRLFERETAPMHVVSSWTWSKRGERASFECLIFRAGAIQGLDELPTHPAL